MLQPLLTSLVFTVFFGHVAKIPTDGIPPVLFYLCNQLSWNYLQQNLTTGGTTFTANAYLFGKVYFPRLVMPLSIVFSNLFACLLQLALFLGIFFGYQVFRAGRLGAASHSAHLFPAAPLPLTSRAFAGRQPLAFLADAQSTAT